jgi:hypothetical protein
MPVHEDDQVIECWRSRCTDLSHLRRLPRAAAGSRQPRRPTLAGLFGRGIATLSGFNFSPELKRLDIVWTPETVAKLFELGPATFTPGTKMPEQRITSAADRAAEISREGHEVKKLAAV